MSEPASLIVRCQIPPEGLRHALNTPGPQASAWQDWEGLDYELTAADMADLDGRTGGTLADWLRERRHWAEVPADWLFAYDAPSQSLTIGQLLFSQNLIEITAGLTLLRRLGAGMVSGQQGLILVHDTVFGSGGTLAAVSLTARSSAIIPPDALPVDPGAFAAPVVDPIRAVVDGEDVGDLPPVRDDLDEMAG